MKTPIATNPSQSARLIVYGVPEDSADMVWTTFENDGEKQTQLSVMSEYAYEASCLNPIPAWSLSALLSLLPPNIPQKGKGKWWFEFSRDSEGFYYAGYRQDKNHILEPTPIHTNDPFEALLPVFSWLRIMNVSPIPPVYTEATVSSVVDMITLLSSDTRSQIIAELNNLSL